MASRHLSHRVYDRLLRVLPRLYAATTVAELRARAAHLALQIVDAEGCGWFDFKLAKAPKVMTFDESTPVITPDVLSRMPAAIASHPHIEIWLTGDPCAQKMSDVPSKRRNRYQDENRQAYDGVGREHLSVPMVANPSRITALSYRRTRKPFTDEDLWALQLLAPHLKQALANARAFERYESLASAATASPAATRLTPRELEVGYWLSQGKTNLEIGSS